MKRSRNASPPQPTSAPVRVPAGLAISFAVLLLLWIAGAMHPELRTWGFHQAAYVPPLLAASLFAVCVLTLVPAIGLRVGSWMETLAQRLAGDGPGSTVTAAVAAGIAGVLFYALAIPFSFLGDSFLYLAEIIRTADSGQVDFFRYNSLLSSFIFLYGGAKLMTFLNVTEVAEVFWVITAICGAAFVFVLLRGAKTVAEDAVGAAILIGLTLGLGGVILFFGYVEYYAPLFAATLAFAVVLCRTIRRNGSLVFPAILLALCIAFHFLALFYVPAFLLALFQQWQRRKGKTLPAAAYWRIVVAGVVLILGVVTVVILFRIPPLYASLIPFSRQSWTGTYTMLSSYHLLDLLNEMLLVGAVPTALAIGLFAVKRIRIPFDNPVIQVFFVFMLSLLLLAIVHFPFYGMARDWDIYAPLGIAVAFFVFAVLQSMRLEHVFRRYIAGVVVTWSAIFLTLWVYTNVSEASALRRYTDILRLDEDHVYEDFAQYGYLNLRKYYRHRGDDVRSARAFRRMIELRGYPWDIAGFVTFVNAMEKPLTVTDDIDAVRGLVMQKSRDSLLMSVTQGATREDSSEYVIDQLYFLGPEITRAVLTGERIRSFAEAHPGLPQSRLLVYALEPPADRSALDEYLAVYEESQALAQGKKPLLSVKFRAGITYVIGQMYEQLNRADSARIWYARSYDLDPARAEFLDDYGLLVSRFREYDLAARLFEEAIDTDPAYAEAYVHLGAYYMQVRGDNETATRLFEQFLVHSQDQAAKSRVQDLLNRIAGADQAAAD